jgi:histidine ammonia-lyase
LEIERSTFNLAAMELNGKTMTLTEIATVALGDTPVKVSSSASARVLASRKVIEDIVARDAVVYGVSTGFGKLSDVRIPRGELFAVTLAELAIPFQNPRCAR